jgi:hypothetical protein
MAQHTRSKASLLKLLQADEQASVPSHPLPDPRSQQLEARIVVEPSFVEAVREVFQGTDFLENKQKVAQLVQVRCEITEHWSGMRDRFLAIGRALLALDMSLTKAETERLRAGTQKLFPFSAGIASQLKQVARSVQSGRISVEACPGSYSAAYQIVQMSDAQLRQAEAEGLVRPDVSRSALIEFRRRVPDGVASQARLLHDERRRLKRREASLKKEMVTIRDRLMELDRLLGTAKARPDKPRAGDATRDSSE